MWSWSGDVVTVIEMVRWPYQPFCSLGRLICLLSSKASSEYLLLIREKRALNSNFNPN